VWLDENHLLAWLYFWCSNPDRGSRKIQSVVAIFDTNGHVVSSNGDQIASVARGPVGTALIGHGRSGVDLVDVELHVQQTLLCPEGLSSCIIFTPPSPSAHSDLALCSSGGIGASCYFYRGNPAARVAERTFSSPLTNGVDGPYDEKPGLPAGTVMECRP
jgi:hypothetical protein